MRLRARWRSLAPPRIGEDIMIAFRADRVVVQPAGGPPSENGLLGEVEAAAFLGTCFEYTIRSGTVQMQAESPVDHPVARGQAVAVSIAPDQCHAFRSAAES